MKQIQERAAKRFASFLLSPNLPIALGFLAVFLTLPSLWVGLQFDDYLLEQSVREASDPLTVVNGMFVFMDGVAAHTLEKMETGVYPWFALPEGKVAFWRPLSAFTHWLDFELFPNRPALMHAQNIIWFALGIFLAVLLYREFLPPLTAGIAALLFAVDDAHGYAVGWVSNRNVLMAFVFGLLSLWFFHRHTKAGKHRRLGLLAGSSVSFVFALLSAEAGLSIFGYLLAYALILNNRPSMRKWATLLPHLLILIVWGYFYRTAGYGGWGTSYIDPSREFLPFLLAVLERAPVLWLGFIVYPPSELYSFVTDALIRSLWVSAGLLLLIWFAVKIIPEIRRNNNLQFLLVGAGFSLLLNCSSLPANRLMFFSGFGGMAALAMLLQMNLPNWIKGSLWFIHLGMAVTLLPLTSYSPRLFGDIEPAILYAPIKPTVIIVSAPSAFHAGYFNLIRARYGTESPERVWYLGADLSSMTVHRLDEKTLGITARDGYISGFDSVFRGKAHPVRVGEAVDLNGLRVTVQETTRDGRPAVVVFEFAKSLESKNYQWLIWQLDTLTEWRVPDIGDSIHIP